MEEAPTEPHVDGPGDGDDPDSTRGAPDGELSAAADPGRARSTDGAADDGIGGEKPSDDVGVQMYPAESSRRRVAFDVDDEELVGPGGFPLRIQPAAAIGPGTADAKRLLTIWFVRKSFYWLFFVGLTIGLTAAVIRHDDTDVEVTDPSSLTGTWILVLVALVVRFGAGWIALALTAPMVLAHEPNLSPRTNFGAGIGIFFDRLNLARAFRALRWTHHVRQVALHRLGDTGERLGKLDPILDIVNITSGVLTFVVPVIVGGIVGT